MFVGCFFDQNVSNIEAKWCLWGSFGSLGDMLGIIWAKIVPKSETEAVFGSIPGSKLSQNGSQHPAKSNPKFESKTVVFKNVFLPFFCWSVLESPKPQK